MKLKKITILSLILICFAFLISACTNQTNIYQVEKKIGDNTVVLQIKNNPPIQGKNEVEVRILDSTKMPAKDASVSSLEYAMPAMNGMPAMKYTAEMMLDNNSYKGSVDFSMSGSWTINVMITQAGDQSQQVDFNVDVK